MSSESAEDVFSDHRDALFGLAYRMLGSRADAEDVVQDVWVRWQEHADSVEYPTSWLRKTTTNAAIDEARSARRRRESYVGPWLPEPLYERTDRAMAPLPESSPERSVALAESLRIGMLYCLEALSPLERAAFLLREIYDFQYAELARTLDRTQAACRKLVSRASQKLDAKEQTPSHEKANTEQLNALLEAVRSDDPEDMKRLLVKDVEAITDSDGKRSAARRAIVGRDRVVAFLEGLKSSFSDIRLERVPSNAETLVAVYTSERLESVMGIDASPSGVLRLFFYRNPEKLPDA